MTTAREAARLRAQEWAGVLSDYAMELLATQGEAVAETFWNQLVGGLAGHHPHFARAWTKVVRDLRRELSDEVGGLLAEGRLADAVERLCVDEELPWREALDVLAQIGVARNLDEEHRRRGETLLIVTRCPARENPRLEAVRHLKRRGLGLEAALAYAEGLAREFDAPLPALPSAT